MLFVLLDEQDRDL